MPRKPVPRQRFTMKKNPMKMLTVLGGFLPPLASPSHHGQLKRRHFILITLVYKPINPSSFLDAGAWIMDGTI